MSIEGEDFTVACVDSRFDVAPIDPLKNVIQTWVQENAKNRRSPVYKRVFTMLLKFYLLPLTPILLRIKCRYMSLVYNDLTHFDLRCVGFFPSHFFSQTANLSSGMNDFDVFIMLLNNIHFYIAKKTTLYK